MVWPKSVVHPIWAVGRHALFGKPKAIACTTRKLSDINADINDIYHNTLEYPNKMLGNLTVDVISRPKAIREFRLIGSEGEIHYSADSNSLKYINLKMEDWECISFESGTIEAEYINPEEPYINEIQQFITAIRKKNINLFPNSLEDDYYVLQTLYELEKLAGDNNELPR